jgi:hypothetical protein
MVMGMAQRTALNKTALKMVGWFDRWGKQLTEEMEKQNISRHALWVPVERPKGTPSFFGRQHTDDNDEPITLRRGLIRQLLDEMDRRAKELSRFEKK